MSERASAYEKSVFINCLFDAQYKELLLGIAFSVACHDFVPCSARENEETAEPRISRVLNSLSGCKYSIHDLSRFSGEGEDRLSRFNMPLELGMAMALRHERMNSVRPHNWLVLVPEGFMYQRFISDLAGFDPAKHDQSVAAVIREVSGWLRKQPDAGTKAPSARQIFDGFSLFREDLRELEAAALQKESWMDIVLACGGTVPRL